MAEELKGKRIAFAVATEGIEQIELTRPWEAVRDAGAETDLIAPEDGSVQAFNHLDKADRFDVDRTFEDADADEYDGLVLPGGVANPDQLRTVPEAVSFIRAFFEANLDITSELPRSPAIKPRAFRIIDLPAPVSPVIMFSPDWRSRPTSSITAKFLMRSSRSIRPSA